MPEIDESVIPGKVAVDEPGYRLKVAVRAVTASAKYLKAAEIARNIVTKGDGTPASDADRNAELILRQHIEHACPHDGILGEELPIKEGDNGSRWSIDPIDGTESYIRGAPLYGTLVGWQRDAASDSEVEIGAAYLPMLDELYYAEKGHGAWLVRNGMTPQRLRVSQNADLSAAGVSTTSVDYFDRAGCWEAFNEVSRRAGVNRCLSDCYGPLLVARGQLDAVYEPLVYPYDIAALDVIVREAGGRFTNWKGDPTINSRTALFSNGVLHDAMLQILRPYV